MTVTTLDHHTGAAPTSPASPVAPAAGARRPDHRVVGRPRTVRKFVRTPQLVVVGTIQGAMFLLIFRYVFGRRHRAPAASPTSTSSSPAS